MTMLASQITSLTVVYSIVYSGVNQRKHQSSASLAICAGNSPGTGEFPAQMASYAENVSIWWRHHVEFQTIPNMQFIVSICKVMAWHQKGDMPLLELMVSRFYESIWRHWATVTTLSCQQIHLDTGISVPRCCHTTPICEDAQNYSETADGIALLFIWIRSHMRGADAGGGRRKIGMRSHIRGRGAKAEREQNPLRNKWVQYPIPNHLCHQQIENLPASAPRISEHTRGSVAERGYQNPPVSVGKKGGGQMGVGRGAKNRNLGGDTRKKKWGKKGAGVGRKKMGGGRGGWTPGVGGPDPPFPRLRSATAPRICERSLSSESRSCDIDI